MSPARRPGAATGGSKSGRHAEGSGPQDESGCGLLSAAKDVPCNASYTIRTVDVPFGIDLSIDSKNGSRMPDGVSVKPPSVKNPCKTQLWEARPAYPGSAESRRSA